MTENEEVLNTEEQIKAQLRAQKEKQKEKFKEFKAFAFKGNIVDLSIGVCSLISSRIDLAKGELYFSPIDRLLFDIFSPRQ